MMIFIARLMIAFFIIGFAGLILSRLFTVIYASTRIYNRETVSPHSVAIVFGAGLRRDGTPTTVLRDRVSSAASLYFSGKVSKLLMSGDNRTDFYNEPEAMRQLALELGVSEEDILLDYAGLRTYDTCFRARNIFGIRDAILVTQGFHLPRSLYTCNRLGVSSVGVAADQSRYHKALLAFWNVREAFATLKAIWEIDLSRSFVALGKCQPISRNEKEG